MKPKPEMTETLTIREVSQRLNITKHTLRFWEKELEGILVPLRTRGGQRRYDSENLFTIANIKRLKKEGMSLASIRKRLRDGKKGLSDDSFSEKIDLIADEVAEMVKSAIYSFLQKENLE